MSLLSDFCRCNGSDHTMETIAQGNKPREKQERITQYRR